MERLSDRQSFNFDAISQLSWRERLAVLLEQHQKVHTLGLISEFFLPYGPINDGDIKGFRSYNAEPGEMFQGCIKLEDLLLQGSGEILFIAVPQRRDEDFSSRTPIDVLIGTEITQNAEDCGLPVLELPVIACGQQKGDFTYPFLPDGTHPAIDQVRQLQKWKDRIDKLAPRSEIYPGDEIASLEADAARCIGQLVAQDMATKTFSYRSILPRYAKIFDLFAQGLSYREILHHVALPDTPNFLQTVRRIIQQLEFDTAYDGLRFHRSYWIASEGMEKVVKDVDTFITEVFLPGKRTRRIVETTRKMPYALGYRWVHMTQEERKHLLLSATTVDGTHDIAGMYGLYPSAASNFFKILDSVFLDGYKYEEIRPGKNQDAPHRHRLVGFRDQEEIVRVFTSILHYLSDQRLLSSILPGRVTVLTQYMDEYCQKSRKGLLHMHILEQLGQQHGYSMGAAYQLFSRCAVVCDFLSRFQSIRQDQRWDNPLVTGWSLLHLADYMKERVYTYSKQLMGQKI